MSDDSQPIEIDLSNGIRFLQMVANGGILVDRAKFLNLREAVELCYALAEKDGRISIRVHPESTDALPPTGPRQPSNNS